MSEILAEVVRYLFAWFNTACYSESSIGGRRQEFGRSEVSQLEYTTVIEETIAGFDIPMHNLTLMTVFKCSEKVYCVNYGQMNGKVSVAKLRVQSTTNTELQKQRFVRVMPYAQIKDTNNMGVRL